MSALQPLTPRETQARARLSEMLDCVALCKGPRFAAVTFATVQSRRAALEFKARVGRPLTRDERMTFARVLTENIELLVRAYGLDVGTMREALKHGRIIFETVYR